MKARFFCESCGAEVSHSQKVCPSCGRTFTAVKCPQCGFEGGAKQFARGCPQCGYLNVLPPTGDGAGARGGGSKSRSRVRARSLPRLRLPARFYRVAGAILLILLLGMIVLLVVVTRR
jgi:RNA polymerase subunit RPABC4/transcription elongation factor Spt4